jgi:hypothetical protein
VESGKDLILDRRGACLKFIPVTTDPEPGAAVRRWSGTTGQRRFELRHGVAQQDQRCRRVIRHRKATADASLPQIDWTKSLRGAPEHATT